MRKTLLALTLLIASPALAQEQQPPSTDAAAPVPQAVIPVSANPVMTGPRMLIATAMGDIILQLDSARAPKSVANVLRYVREKHYDNTAFYRVAKGFVIQMGSWDTNGKPRGIHPGPVPLESGNGLSNLRGTVAMARAEAPDSATAEFFINLADNIRLNRDPNDPGSNTGYAVFGQVVSGMEVVDAIANVPTGDNGPMPGQAPITPILVKKVTLLK